MSEDKITFDEILDFNRRYSYIECIAKLSKVDDNIVLDEVASVYLICGFGDNGDFKIQIEDEDFNDLIGSDWCGDGWYNLDFVYRNVRDGDGHQIWYEHHIEDFKFYKQEEESFNNGVPFDWDL